MKEVVECSGASHIAKNIAKRLKANYSRLELKKFPDGELNIRFKKNIKGKEVILIQSFYGDISQKIVEILFAGYTAKDLGAKKVYLISLYFPYFRKDKRFEPGESVSIEVMAKLFKIFDKVLVIEPHLHRIKNLRSVFPNTKRIQISDIIADYIKKQKIKDKIFIGPDSESLQWAKSVADSLGEEVIILKKQRKTSRKVKIKIPKTIELKRKNVIIIDDIISTGHTMLETIKEIKKLKPKKVYCIAIHGVFAENALKKLNKHAKVLSTNTIPSKASKIDISKITNKIKKEIK